MITKELILKSVEIDNKIDFLKSINDLSDSHRVYMRMIWFLSKSSEVKHQQIWQKIKIAVEENFVNEALSLSDHFWKNRIYDIDDTWNAVSKKITAAEQRRLSAKIAETPTVKDDAVPF